MKERRTAREIADTIIADVRQQGKYGPNFSRMKAWKWHIEKAIIEYHRQESVEATYNYSGPSQQVEHAIGMIRIDIRQLAKELDVWDK